MKSHHADRMRHDGEVHVLGQYEEAVEEAERLTDESLSDALSAYRKQAKQHHLLLSDPENPFSEVLEFLKVEIKGFRAGRFDSSLRFARYDRKRLQFRARLASILQTATVISYEVWTADDDQCDPHNLLMDSSFEGYETEEDRIRGTIMLHLCELLHLGYRAAQEKTPSHGKLWLQAYEILDMASVCSGYGISEDATGQFHALFDQAAQELRLAKALDRKHEWFTLTEEYEGKKSLPTDLWIDKYGNGPVGKRFRLVENGSTVLDVVQKIAWPCVLTGEPRDIIFELLQSHAADPAATSSSSKTVHGKTKRLTNLFQAGRAQWTFKNVEIATPGVAHRDIKPGHWRILLDSEVKPAPRGAPWRVCRFDGTNYQLVEDPSFRPPRPSSRV